MSHQKIVLILGSGPRVGRHISRAFAAKGYQVALASRTLKDEDKEPGQTHFQVDLSNPSSVPELFSQVKTSLGVPDVVVYNGKGVQLISHSTTHILPASAGAFNDPKNPFSISLRDFEQAININTTSVFAAAQQAAAGFAQLSDSASKTFIYTGNALNSLIIAPMMAAGVGKSGAAHMMQSAAQLSVERGFQFVHILLEINLKLT